MKRIMVLLGLGSCLLLSSSLSSHADMPVSVSDDRKGLIEPLVTWHTDLQSGWRESKRLGVPMVIFITSEDCVYCDAMKQNTWCNQSIKQRLANKFVAIRLNPKRNGSTLDRIKIETYPTTLLGSPNGKVIAHRVGYQPPEALQAFLVEATRTQSLAANSTNTIH